MGVGRREFLKLTRIALAGLAVNPLQAVVTNDNVYVNRKLGILFEKPDLWGFIGVKDFGKLKEEQILGNGWEDEKGEVWETIGDPICIATKYPSDNPKYNGVFSPTMILHITHKSELNPEQSFQELMDISEHNLTEILIDFKVVKKHEPYTLSGCTFYENDSEYLFEHAEFEQPIKTELKLLIAEHNDFYYYFNFHQSKEQNQSARLEIEAIKNSIKLI